MFEHSHLDYQLLYDLTNRTDNPNLVEMTRVALKILQKNPKGYFLLVEGVVWTKIGLNNLFSILRRTNRSRDA